jgi:hypothetical protein
MRSLKDCFRCFDIVIQGADLNVAKSLVCPRDLTIVGIDAVNTAAGAGTLLVEKVTTLGVATTITGTTAAPPVAGNGVVQAQAQIGPTAPVTVIAANAALKIRKNRQAFALFIL